MAGTCPHDTRSLFGIPPRPDNSGGSTAPITGRAPALATFLIDWAPQDMSRRLGDALGVYVDAMSYPRGTETQRASTWLEHTCRRGWTAVAAVEADHRAGEAPSATR